MDKFVKYVLILLMLVVVMEGIGIVVMMDSLYEMETHMEKLHEHVVNQTTKNTTDK